MPSSAVLKVGGLDLSAYLRLHEDESPALDPGPQDYLVPQYGGSPAFAEGQSWVADAAANKDLTIPLLLEGATRPVLHGLIQTINKAVELRGSQVEFSSDASSPSTFFTLERGKLDVQYEYFLTGVALTTRATLTLTVRPYGSTATMRLVASVPMASSAVAGFPATGVLGDYNSLASLEVKVGSQVASAGRVIAWGVHPHPSNNPYQAATSGFAQASSTVKGASGAIASQYTAIPISPTGASGVAYTAYLSPPDAHIGRHRIFAVGRSALSVPIPLWAEDRWGTVAGPTALASQTNTEKWQLIDLGEVQVPARASGQDTVPTQYVKIHGGGATTAEMNASPAFHLNGIMFLPIDYSAGVLRMKGANQTALFRDYLGRWWGLGEGQDLIELPNADVGIWSKMSGKFAISGKAQALGYPYVTIAPGAPETGKNATAVLYAGASGIQAANIFAQVALQMSGNVVSKASEGSASSAVTLWAPAQSNASIIIGGVGAKFQLGPTQFLSIFSASSNGATVLKASAGMATTLASAVITGAPYILAMRVNEGRVDTWIGRGGIGGASPTLSASAADLTSIGWFALAAQGGPNAIESNLSLTNISFYGLGVGSDMGAREAFRFESYPEGRVYQGSASVFLADQLANFRGGFPQIPPTGSPGPTGPARAVVLQGEIDNLVGNDGMDIALSVMERFRFLR